MRLAEARETIIEIGHGGVLKPVSFHGYGPIAHA
jgi:hypothetical protein